MLDAPAMGRFIAGFALAAVFERARQVPATILVRDLQFRTVAIVNSIGELTFTGVALLLAALWGWGGYAIMAGAIGRSVITFVLFSATAPRHEWLERSPIQKDLVRHFFGYGTPIMLSTVADRAASTWTIHRAAPVRHAGDGRILALVQPRGDAAHLRRRAHAGRAHAGVRQE